MISEIQCRTQQQANYIVAIKTYAVSGVGSDGCVTGYGGFFGEVGCGLGYNGVYKWTFTIIATCMNDEI